MSLAGILMAGAAGSDPQRCCGDGPSLSIADGCESDNAVNDGTHNLIRLAVESLLAVAVKRAADAMVESW